MVFYYTGTGNSLYIAQQLEEECISIPQAIRQPMYYKADKIGIVCPVHHQDLPPIVKYFIHKAGFHTDFIYLVMTYGHDHGDVLKTAKMFFHQANKTLSYTNTIEMPDNYLPDYDMDAEIGREDQLEIDEKLKRIKKDVDIMRLYNQPITDEDYRSHDAYAEILANRPEEFLVEPLRVTKKCMGCGICTRVCPLGCISLYNQQALMKLKNQRAYLSCNTCMACIQACPLDAIELTIPEKNPHARYRNKHVSLMDLIESNEVIKR